MKQPLDLIRRLWQRMSTSRRSMSAVTAANSYRRILAKYAKGTSNASNLEVSAVWNDFLPRIMETLSKSKEPLPTEKFLLMWQEALSNAMARACVGTPRADLLCAIRLLDPHVVEELGIREPIGSEPVGAMACRRAASHAALLYGSDGGLLDEAPYGGKLAEKEAQQFASSFSNLLPLAGAYMLAHSLRGITAAGIPFQLSPSGPIPIKNAQSDVIALLIWSFDRRKGPAYSPFTRIGEFIARAQPTTKPDGMSLVSARYYRNSVGTWSYQWIAWGLDPLREFFVEADQDLCNRAIGMPGIAFAVLLAGLCRLIVEALTIPENADGFTRSALVPLTREAIHGEALLRHASGYLQTAGYDPKSIDLLTAREQFLWLASSEGKWKVDELPLKIQLGDTRNSYLLHHFGNAYLADLFHSDHWLHRPLELMAAGAQGKQAAEKGKRFERKLWEYLESVKHLRAVVELRGQRIARSASETQDDLDCTFALGRILLLIEAKSELLRFPAETLYRAAMEARWTQSAKYLDKIDATARLLATQHDQPSLQRGLTGITHILPLVCRPYPEWMPSLETRYWLRLPDQSRDDPGLPRILTPHELYGFLSGVDEERLVASAEQHLIPIASFSPSLKLP